MNGDSDFFENDDYSILNQKYFKILREGKSLVADPSGWIDTHSKVAELHNSFNGEIQGYHTDISNQLLEKKKYLLDLFSEWDACSYRQENVTLCHSATVSSVVVMALLISKGVKNIICETPNYFATYHQAESMGLNMTRIPTFYNENFELSIDSEILQNSTPCAIWLTQPRTSLGFNQDVEEIRKLILQLGKNDFIVVDEATEQFFPSVLAPINPENYPQIIKIRSVFKGLGINGIRLAYIAHHHSLRIEMADQMEIFLGALDIYSLNHAVELSKNVKLFKTLLETANQQVIMLHERASKVVVGTPCELSKIINGYIGSAMVKFDNTSQDARILFIEHCTRHKVPVILGAAMGFARHKDMEFVRLNYFNRDHNIINGLRIISQFQI